MDQQLEKINSVVTLVAFIQTLAPDRRRLYRGQPVDKPLLPRFAREAQSRRLPDPLTSERELLQNFRALSVPYIREERPQGWYEWLAIAQHHGIPTRLLDWTGNPLFALWFSLPSEASDENATFWVLDVRPEHMIPVSQIETDIFDLKRTQLFRPSHVTRRIVAQDGWFTAHWYIEKKNKFVPLEQQPRFKKNLRKLVIPAKYHASIRRDLRALGISDAVLYPDLPTLCKQLVADFFGDATETSAPPAKMTTTRNRRSG